MANERKDEILDYALAQSPTVAPAGGADLRQGGAQDNGFGSAQNLK